MTQIYRLIVLLLSFSPLVGIKAQVVPLVNAHAHNDYENPRPLLDALRHGFTSVEADVFLAKGELYVAHNRPLSLKNVKTLEQAYLKPLDSIVAANRGQVFPGFDGTFFLMIDFKTKADETYRALLAILHPYRHLLRNSKNQGPVAIFISGERPLAEILNDPESPVGLDGRPNDLDQGIPKEKMPVISTSFKSLGSWNGVGEIPLDLRLKIRQMSESAHKEGKLLRLWAIPDNPHSWQVMLDNGVDLINTDKLEDLKNFLLK